MTAIAIDATADALAERLRGALLAPGDAGFDDATRALERDDRRRPRSSSSRIGTADVVAAVGFAREHGLLLSVKGGGHNIAGTALAEAA